MRVPRWFWVLSGFSWAAGMAVGVRIWVWCWEIRGVLR